MPLYDFECRNCGALRVDEYIPLQAFHENGMFYCGKCRRARIHDLIVRPPAVDDWGCNQEGKFFEHLSGAGMYFRDRRSFKDYLRRNGIREKNSFVD